jgi:hypothetical protein
LETLEKHKYVQECLLSLVLPEMESLDLHAKMSVKQKAISMDNSATAVEEKKNPMACQLLMKIPKIDMPGVSLLLTLDQIGKSQNFSLLIQSDGKMRLALSQQISWLTSITILEMWFFLFLPYICNAVKLQGWKEKEDCPVIAGEEALDKVLKPYAEDSRMNMMFDFSNMEAFEIQDDIQQQSLCPKKKG